jgi:hypothetical protein
MKRGKFDQTSGYRLLSYNIKKTLQFLGALKCIYDRIKRNLKIPSYMKVYMPRNS